MLCLSRKKVSYVLHTVVSLALCNKVQWYPFIVEGGEEEGSIFMTSSNILLLCFPPFPSPFFREFGDTEVERRKKAKRTLLFSGSMLRIKGGEEEGIKGSLSFIEDTFLCLCASCCPLFTSLPCRYSRSRQNIADKHRREKGEVESCYLRDPFSFSLFLSIFSSSSSTFPVHANINLDFNPISFLRLLLFPRRPAGGKGGISCLHSEAKNVGPTQKEEAARFAPKEKGGRKKR